MCIPDTIGSRDKRWSRASCIASRSRWCLLSSWEHSNSSGRICRRTTSGSNRNMQIRIWAGFKEWVGNCQLLSQSMYLQKVQNGNKRHYIDIIELSHKSFLEFFIVQSLRVGLLLYWWGRHSWKVEARGFSLSFETRSSRERERGSKKYTNAAWFISFATCFFPSLRAATTADAELVVGCTKCRKFPSPLPEILCSTLSQSSPNLCAIELNRTFWVKWHIGPRAHFKCIIFSCGKSKQ